MCLVLANKRPVGGATLGSWEKWGLRTGFDLDNSAVQLPGARMGWVS